jgi:hypothetical protein
MEYEQEIVATLNRIAFALESIDERTRRLVEPTDEEIKKRLEKTMGLAMLLGMSRGQNEPLN